MIKKSKKSSGPTSAELQKELNQYLKDRDAKATKLRNSIQSLERDLEKLQKICNQAEGSELIKTQRIIEAKIDRLDRAKIELREFESSIESNLQLLNDIISRVRNHELNLDAETILVQSENALKKYRMLKCTVEAINADKDL